MPSNATREFICAQCGQLSTTRRRQRTQRYCSTACRATGRMVPVVDRLWAKTSRGDGCWIWNGGRTLAGYGLIGGGRQTDRHLLTHRVAYESAYGPIPNGLWVLHRCDNPPCVRPEHLFLGTNSDNIRDCFVKGRWTNPKTGKRGM